MKKFLTLILLILLAGCSDKEKIFNENMKKYESAWKVLLNENQFRNSSRHFDIMAEIYKEDKGYSYLIQINNPKIAMYDVEVMVIENKEPYSIKEKMLPSSGIFDEPVNLVPNQVRKDSDFREGVLLGRDELESPKVTLQVQVSWKNYTKVDTFKEVFELQLQYEEPVVEPTPEETPTETPAE